MMSADGTSLTRAWSDAVTHCSRLAQHEMRLHRWRRSPGQGPAWRVSILRQASDAWFVLSGARGPVPDPGAQAEAQVISAWQSSGHTSLARWAHRGDRAAGHKSAGGLARVRPGGLGLVPPEENALTIHTPAAATPEVALPRRRTWPTLCPAVSNSRSDAKAGRDRLGLSPRGVQTSPCSVASWNFIVVLVLLARRRGGIGGRPPSPVPSRIHSPPRGCHVSPHD